MELEINYDCFRDVLKYLMDNLDYEDIDSHEIRHRSINWQNILNNTDLQQSYSKKIIAYTIEKLLECNYIIADDYRKNSNGSIIVLSIIDISMSGYEFYNLANNDTTWNHLKGGFKRFGGFSLEVLKSMLPELIKMYIESKI